MMHVLMSFFITLVLLTSTSSSICYAESHANQISVSQSQKRTEVIKVFKRAIDLNEDFKSSMQSPLAEQLEKREKLEKFHEEILWPNLSNCAKLLSSGNDAMLAIQLFDLLISFQNSADEQLAFYLGEIFHNNPELVIATLKKYGKDDQKVLYRYLDWGWANFVWGRKVPESIFVDRKKKILKLQVEIVGDETDYYYGLKDKMIIIPNGKDTQKNQKTESR